MELKRVNEYKRPEYPTVEESKNRILMMLVRSGKISLGVAVMCLLCNYSFANLNVTDISQPLAGVQVSPEIRFLYKLQDLSVYAFFYSLLLTIIFTIVNQIIYIKCKDVTQKARLRKLRNLVLYIGTGVTVGIFAISYLLACM